MRKKTQRTVVSGIMALTLAALPLLGGCSGKNDNEAAAPASGSSQASAKPAEKIHLKYYNWNQEGPATVMTQKLISGFQAKYPNVTVESVSLVPGNSVESLKKMDVLMSSGEQVDIVMLPSIEETISRAAQGVLTPLNEFYTKEGIAPQDVYYINPKYKDNYYGLMFTASRWMVMINEDALKAANLPLPSFDWTWDDFRDYAKKMTKGEGNNKQYGAFFHSWGEYANFIAFTDKPSPFITPELKPLFSDPSFKQFFELRKAMEQEDKSAKPLADVIGAKLSYINEFLTGKAAMLPTGSFALGNVNNVEKYPHTFKTVFAPLPRSSKTAEPGLTNMGGNYLSIAQSSKNKQAAYDFIRYMSTNEQEFIDVPGIKNLSSNDVLKRIYDKGNGLIDIDSMKTAFYDPKVHTVVSADLAVPYGGQLKKVIEDGLSKYLLDNTPIEKVQSWMMEEGEKIIKQNTK